MMSPDPNIPVCPSTDATATAIALPSFLPSMQEAYCVKVKREIKRYGVEQALLRWRVMCDYMQTEEWWPYVARKVEEVFDDAFDALAFRQDAERQRQLQPQVSLTVSQTQSNKDEKTDNRFENGSSNQVFTGDANGHFIK